MLILHFTVGSTEQTKTKLWLSNYITHLKNGTGNPTTGQVRNTDFPECENTISPPSYFFPGNFGLILLVGSNNILKQYFHH